MGESIFVNISGYAFSCLLYENTRTNFDQEGFLLGEIVTKEKQTITDNDQQVLNIERVIKINSVVPWPIMTNFYNNAGRIDKDKINKFLVDTDKKNVVAWYKFKHTNSFQLTLREKIVYKQLCTLFSPEAPDRFACCLLTTQSGSESGATHLFSQTFVRYYNSHFPSLPMHIINLKDPHDLYKSAEDCSVTFKKLVKDLRIKMDQLQNYDGFSKIEKALDEHISAVVEDLSEVEKRLYDMDGEIKRLRKKLSILHDCGDVDYVFDIMENGKEIPEPSSSQNKGVTSRRRKGSQKSCSTERNTRSKVNKNLNTSREALSDNSIKNKT